MALNYKSLSVAAMLLLLLLSGCKPTEDNYRKAYETAQQARQREQEADAALGIPQLQSVDGPPRSVVGTDSVYVRHEALALNGAEPQSGLLPVNVAVGKYKMTANARGDADNLRADGFDAFVLANADGEFYAVAGCAASLPEGVALLKKVRKKYPQRPYVGLPGEPVLMIPYGARY